MDTESFYSNLPVLNDFADVSQTGNYADVPDDWHVAVSDVEGSTIAVRAGRYKDVNLLGASSIISVLNAVRPREIPFIFGGDGSSLCIPPTLIETTREALLATQKLADEEFGMRLRVGIIPVRFILEHGQHVRVARVRTTSKHVQAAFSGGGIQFAERCIKDAAMGRPFRIERDSWMAETPPVGDFSGLECRWDNIPSPHGEMVTLLVQATGASAAGDAAIYRDVLDAISAIYGRGRSANPVEERSLRLTLEKSKLDSEARLRVRPRLRAVYRGILRFQSVVGRFLMDHRIRFAGVDWGEYRGDVIANSDYRKFDDQLRHVLSGNAAQREQLTAMLEQRCQRGELVYGMHCAPTALMTCLIFQREGAHIHFVDGADGGYTLASEDLKKRLARRISDAKTA